MSLGLIGRKVGMTRLFTDEGEAIPVTVIDVSDNRVAQVKTQATDGYDAVQLAHGTRRTSRVNKAMAGHFAKAGVMAGNALNEFHVEAEKLAEMKKVNHGLTSTINTILQQVKNEDHQSLMGLRHHPT